MAATRIRIHMKKKKSTLLMITFTKIIGRIEDIISETAKIPRRHYYIKCSGSGLNIENS